jgi:hypothetical protein
MIVESVDLLSLLSFLPLTLGIAQQENSAAPAHGGSLSGFSAFLQVCTFARRGPAA